MYFTPASAPAPSFDFARKSSHGTAAGCGGGMDAQAASMSTMVTLNSDTIAPWVLGLAPGAAPRVGEEAEEPPQYRTESPSATRPAENSLACTRATDATH